MSRDLTKAIIGIFVGTIFGLFMTLTYWGHAAYQIIFSIIGGSLLGYFCVAPRQAWQQMKLAEKKAMSDWPKKIIDKVVNYWQGCGYLYKRFYFMLIPFGVSIFFVFLLYDLTRANVSSIQSFSVYFFVFIISLGTAGTVIGMYNFVILPSLLHFASENKVFNKLWQPYILENIEQIKLFKEKHEEDNHYLNFGTYLITFTGTPWYKYEWILFLSSWIGAARFILLCAKLFLTVIAWAFLLTVVIVLTPLRFLFWFLVIFSTQDLFIKIFTGTAFSVMAGVHYQSYAVGLTAASVFSLTVVLLKRFVRQPFNLFAFLGKESKLRLAFAKVNLFKAS